MTQEDMEYFAGQLPGRMDPHDRAKEVFALFRSFTWSSHTRARNCAYKAVDLVLQHCSEEDRPYWEQVSYELSRV